MKIVIYIQLFQLLEFIHILQGRVISFGLASGHFPIAGSRTTLQCVVSGPQTTYRILKGNGAFALTTCVVSSKCIPSVGDGYTFASLPNGVTIEIETLERTRDETTWTCQDSDKNEKNYYLTVYNVPPSITLDGMFHACDLGISTCQFTCKADGCTYPAPIFSWFYLINNDESATAFPNLGQIITNSQSSGCTFTAKNFQQTLTLHRYTVFSGNIPTTIRLQCKMSFSQLPSVTRMSDFSRDVVFAVKVSAVNITDGGTILPDGELIVVENEPKLLTCMPGKGHPDPKIMWYIGNLAMATGREYSFNPLNSVHDQQIYCIAENIPSNGIVDAVSSKHTLFVSVKTQYVYIEPAENNILLVIENTPEPVVCITSPGRPRSTISWLKQNIDIGEGNLTHFQSTANKLEVTKSTRYFRLSRADSGWKLSCSASNFEGSVRIESNNSKSFTVLYPPEHMSLLFAGKPVVGPVIDVIKGISGNLKCTADSNPSISLFSWNINQINGDTLTIDDNIQNSQIINCTAKNIMTTTSGISIIGYGSISKKINLQYGALITRIELNDNTDPTLIVKEKEPITIACYVDSNPGSTISLFQGSSLLTEKEQSTVLMYNVSSAQCSNTGQYTCKAENGIHNVEQPAEENVQINVECSPRLAVNTDSSVFAQENTSAVLSVTVFAYPIPQKYDWYRNTSNRWEKLKNSTSIQMTQGSLQFNLTFISINPEDYGAYKLTVYNTKGDSFDFTIVLKRHGDQEQHTHQTDDGSTATAGIIGGVVGGLLLVCLIIIVVWILQRRNSFGDIKDKLFGRRSSASREDNLTYEMPNRANQGSEDRTYDIVNQSFSEYENAAPSSASRKGNLTYEKLNRTTQGSEDRTYDLVNQSISDYENAAP